jgi:hypothetical protein
MDRKFEIVCNALAWEARYRKEEHLSGEGLFLPPADSLDPDFTQALELFGIKCGRLLDIGTGFGLQASALPGSGLR